MTQRAIVSLESLFSSPYPYRRFQDYVADVTETLADVVCLNGAAG